MNDEALLLEVLNSSPRLNGVLTESLTGEEGARIARELDGAGDDDEMLLLRQARDAIQDLIRGHSKAAETLQTLMAGANLSPEVTPAGIRWHLTASDSMMPAARVVRAWSETITAHPGRLKACANDECNLFLLDRTRPGTAKWCSMATCGNRMKARTHASRRRNAASRT